MGNKATARAAVWAAVTMLAGAAMAEPATITADPAPVAPSASVQDEKTREYLPADIDVSIGKRDKSVSEAPDAPFVGIEVETLNKRMVDLEVRIENLERLAIQQQGIISALTSGGVN